MPKHQMTVLCTKAAGKLKIFHREAFDREFARFGDGEDLELHLEAVGRKRTHAQNRFFHGPILNAFASTWDCAAYAKTELCLLFLPQEHTRPDGAVVIVPGHTSTLTVEEFNAFIEACIQLAAENGIYIEDAEEWRRNRRTAA